MIYTVTFNPSIDYIVSVKDFKYGKTNRTNTEKILPGGKGINVSTVLKNLGQESTAIGFFAGFTGKAILDMLKSRGIPTEPIFVDRGISRINVKLSSGEETEINGCGPIIEGQEAEQLYQKLSLLQEGDYLVLAGSIPSCLGDNVYRDIMVFLKDKKINIIVDAEKNLLLNVTELKPFLIKPNKQELEDIFGIEIKNKYDAAKYALKLREKGARNVLVSMAGDGAVLASEDGNIFVCDAPYGKVINSVGAGDSMVAGFLYARINGKDFSNSLKIGVCTGSASAFSCDFAEKQDVIALLEKVSIKQL